MGIALEQLKYINLHLIHSMVPREAVMGIALEQLKYINLHLSSCTCSMCGATGRSNFRLDQETKPWLFRYACKCCGYPQIADLMADCPDCHDEYVERGEDGCSRCKDKGFVRYYEILRWRARGDYSAEATKRIVAFSRLQYEAADREWERDWPL